MKPLIALSGDQFNRRYNQTEFIKLTNKECCHNGLQFNQGMNDVNKFNPNGKGQKGKIYFINKIYLAQWLQHTKKMHYVWEIQIPNDASVYFEGNGCFKTDKIIMSKVGTITEYLSNQSPFTVIRMHDRTKHKIRFMKKFDKKTMICFILSSILY